MSKTKIQWTESVWNVTTGCTKVSAGCAHCYAERMARRLAGRVGYPEYPNQFKLTLHPDRLFLPMHWRKPRRIFVDSMSDLFHLAIPTDFLNSVFTVMAQTPRHTYQILTKRPERMYEYMLYLEARKPPAWTWPLPNVWLGTSCEDQNSANERLPWLLRTKAAVHFVSCEPLLENIKIWPYLNPVMINHWGHGLDWVICGLETGPGARFCDPNAVRSLRDQCIQSNTPFFFKSWGGPYHQGWVDEKGHVIYAGCELDGKIWHQYPEGK